MFTFGIQRDLILHLYQPLPSKNISPLNSGAGFHNLGCTKTNQGRAQGLLKSFCPENLCYFQFSISGKTFLPINQNRTTGKVEQIASFYSIHYLTRWAMPKPMHWHLLSTVTNSGPPSGNRKIIICTYLCGFHRLGNTRPALPLFSVSIFSLTELHSG